MLVVLGAFIFMGCSKGTDQAAKTAGESPAKEVSRETAAEPAPTDQAEPGSIEKTSWDAEAGKVVYLKYCHFCHGREGYGDGPIGIAISPHPADFVGDTKRMSKTDAELFKSITEGVHRDIGGEEMAMPRWREILTPEERWNVLAYIRQLEREGKKKLAE